MSELNETPRANRIHIAFFGLRNAGKSTLVNEFTGQALAIVSDTPGTTTDPVSKAMEILPLGPCLITDTAGLDDEGDLGEKRVEKSLQVLATTDIAVWVTSPNDELKYQEFLSACARFNSKVIKYNRGDSIAELKRRIAAVKLEDEAPGLLTGLLKRGDKVLLVVPIDESAPKGRLILPQQQVIRECLEQGVMASVCQPEIMSAINLDDFNLIITDSQAFATVRSAIDEFAKTKPRLTSFSILFARQKGDLDEFLKGITAIKNLQDGDTVLIAEGCTHHRQCNDIGSVKIPKALTKLSGKQFKFVFSSGMTFDGTNASLIVHCGGCMLTRREVLRRIAKAKSRGVAIVNYGMALAAANGINLTEVVP